MYIVSQRLLKVLRQGDMIARIGGDEFAMMIQRSDRKEIEAVINRIQTTIAEKIQIGKLDIVLGSAVGIVYGLDRYKSSEQAINDADRAMYDAKQDKEGIGTYRFFESEIEEKFRNQLLIEEGLQNAWHNEELGLEYQPIISLSDYQIVGYEAFIRWKKNDGTAFTPEEFIPVAEESGIIEELGSYVLTAVSKAVKLLEIKNPNLFVSVNFSVKQILSSKQIEAVRSYQFNSHQFRIEITEKPFHKNYDLTMRSIEQLKDMGIKVFLDDFGTGYSSLSYLNIMEVNDIKIDKIFISKIDEDEAARSVVSSIISVAKTLNMTVTAEGVENGSQLKYLKGLGCDYAQGYYISRPLPLDRILEFGNELPKRER